MLISFQRRGFTLFLVLVLVAIISAMVVSGYYLSMKGLNKAEQTRNFSVSYHAATSAVRISQKLLSRGDELSEKPMVYMYKNIYISVVINDECGKLNVNRVKDKRYFSTLQNLLDNLGLNDDIAYCIEDWIDADSIPESDGAEDYYYKQFGYRPTNGPMKSIYELTYIKGINKGLFEKLKNYLTVYGNGLIDVNSAPKKILISLPGMTESAAESILENRPIKNLSTIKDLPGFTDELYFSLKPLITNRCSYFRIVSTASYRGSVVTVEAFANRKKILEWKVIG